MLPGAHPHACWLRGAARRNAAARRRRDTARAAVVPDGRDELNRELRPQGGQLVGQGGAGAPAGSSARQALRAGRDGERQAECGRGGGLLALLANDDPVNAGQSSTPAGRFEGLTARDGHVLQVNELRHVAIRSRPRTRARKSTLRDADDRRTTDTLDAPGAPKRADRNPHYTHRIRDAGRAIHDHRSEFHGFSAPSDSSRVQRANRSSHGGATRQNSAGPQGPKQSKEANEVTTSGARAVCTSSDPSHHRKVSSNGNDQR